MPIGQGKEPVSSDTQPDRHVAAADPARSTAIEDEPEGVDVGARSAHWPPVSPAPVSGVAMTTTEVTDGMVRGVYAASVDERSRSALEIFLASQYGESIGLTPAEEADVAVFDLDVETAEDDLADYQASFPGHPAIGLSVRPDGYEARGADLRVLAKPPSFSDLREVFDELIAEANGRTDLGAARIGERGEPYSGRPGPERPVAVDDKSGVKAQGGEWHAPYPLAPSAWGEIPELEDPPIDWTARGRNGSAPEAPLVPAVKDVEHSADEHSTTEVADRADVEDHDPDDGAITDPVAGENDDPVEAPAAVSLGLESDSDFYDPEDYLQGPVVDAMVTARSADAAVCLAGDWGELLIDPDGRAATLKGSMSDLRDACAHPVDPASLTVDQPGPAALAAIDDHLPRWTWEGLVWDVTLWVAAGRLPAGTDPDEAVGLRQWPNLARLTIPPHALQIAAVWTRTPMSVSRTTAMLGMDAADVHNFYAAASALGLVVAGAPESGSTYPVIDAEVREILASLLDRVRVRNP